MCGSLMYGYVYMVTNQINNRKYIGMHKSPQFDVNYFGSGILIKEALAKYGRENFTCEVLAECNSREELSEREAFYIKKFNAVNDSMFYNVASGGEGGDTYTGLEEESKLCRNHKISEALKDKPKTEEHRATISRNRTASGIFSGENNPMFGVHRFGELNPNYGKHYYNNGEEEKLLHESDAQVLLNSGWVLGRLPNILDKVHSVNKKRVRINLSNQVEKRVPAEQVDNYLALGWTLGGKYKQKKNN